MEAKDLILEELERVDRNVKRALDTLGKPELAWRPGPECNSIGLIYFHMAHSEDHFVQVWLRKQPEVWEAAKWFEKFGLNVGDTGSGLTAPQLATFNVPPVEGIAAYAGAVRKETVSYIKSLDGSALDRKENIGPFGEISFGAVLGIMVVHAAGHAGEMAYLRGIQRGMNK